MPTVIDVVNAHSRHLEALEKKIQALQREVQELRARPAPAERSPLGVSGPDPILDLETDAEWEEQ